MTYLPPLYPSERQIRHLTLTSSASERILQCALHTVSQASSPEYTALSYVWGDEKIRSTIEINGQMTSITTNLDTALRNLWQKQGEGVSVWADAICINQADDKEKASQVCMMGDIYSNASEVWIWIGGSADNSDLAMDLVGRLADINFEDPDLVLDPVSWKALWFLMRRPWWRRVWVLQEALLAKKATVNCGQIGVAIECFTRLKEVKDQYVRRVEPRLQLVQYVRAAPFLVILSDWDFWKKVRRGGIPLGALLTGTAGFESTLKRDKIFALLAMSTVQDRKALEVNYEEKGPGADVVLCCLVAILLLMQSKRHNCLNLLQRNQQSKSLELPSWVPDYTIDDTRAHLIFSDTEHCKGYSAGADNAAWAAVSQSPLAPCLDPKLNSVMIRCKNYLQGLALILPGLMFDIVLTSHQTPTVPDYRDLSPQETGGFDLEEDQRIKYHRRNLIIEAYKAWQLLAIQLPKDGIDPYKHSSCGRYEAFWRTLIVDRELNWEGPPNAERDFGGRFEAWKQSDPDEAYVRPYSDAAILRCKERSFFITEKGYLGLGPSGTTAGDVVCVLRGGNVPFVLRKSDGRSYNLIGEAYVHGIMDGNVVREAQPEDLKEVWIR